MHTKQETDMHLGPLYYKRDGSVCADILEWAEAFESEDRKVAVTHLDDGRVTVSTVFLGIGHRFGNGPPLIFETMVFGLDEDFQRRYSTEEQAKRGHEAMVRLAQTKLNWTGQMKRATPK